MCSSHLFGTILICSIVHHRVSWRNFKHIRLFISSLTGSKFATELEIILIDHIDAFLHESAGCNWAWKIFKYIYSWVVQKKKLSGTFLMMPFDFMHNYCLSGLLVQGLNIYDSLEKLQNTERPKRFKEFKQFFNSFSRTIDRGSWKWMEIIWEENV